MNYKLLGVLGVLGAPFLFIGSAYFPNQMGLFGLVYMAGWICSLIGLQHLGAAGDGPFGRRMFYGLFTTLTLAQAWNVWTMFDPQNSTLFYRILDMTWPLSNVLMLPLGVAVIRAKRLAGWYRFVPLVVGLWLGFAMLVIGIVGRTPASLIVGGAYSVIAWTLMGFVVYRGQDALRPAFDNQPVTV